MKNCFKEWGYVSNPFKTTPLDANEKGLELLVGRNKEKMKLINRIKSDSGIVTIEGSNGIGKTSIVNTASYELFEDSLMSEEDEMYIPCSCHFQLTHDIDKQEFIDDIYYALAQTLIQKANTTKRIRKKLPSTKNLDAWLNASEIVSMSAQIASIGAGENRSMNSSEGYLKSGFKKEVKEWLRKIFPTSESGGVICMIDNMELLKSSRIARETLEILRDELITIKGTKWIFSGSHGIIRSITGSPRLSGFLLNPIELLPLGSLSIPSILSSRLNSFQSHSNDRTYIPISEEGFVKLYNSLNGNLRETFKKLSSYCLFAYESKEQPHFNSEKDRLFDLWLEQDRQNDYKSLTNLISNRELRLLKLMIDKKSSITAADLRKGGFVNIEDVLNSLGELEMAGLLAIPIFQIDDMQKIAEEDGDLELRDDDSIEIPKGKFDDIFVNLFIAPKGWFIYDKIES